jgi:hypothetical protein
VRVMVSNWGSKTKHCESVEFLSGRSRLNLCHVDIDVVVFVLDISLCEFLRNGIFNVRSHDGGERQVEMSRRV